MSDNCPAALNLNGTHYPCDHGAGHKGTAHSNRDAGAVWDGPYSGSMGEAMRDE